MTLEENLDYQEDLLSDTLPSGTRLEGYTIERVLGRGAFGITYLAVEEALDRHVAIKEYLPQDFAVRDKSSTVRAKTGSSGDLFKYGRDSFIKEARTLVKFKHHNIVRVLTFFEHYDTAYIVMEYEEGLDFRDYLKNNPELSQARLLEIFIPINKGLEVVHQHGFIHRDIKPDNIYIRKDQSPVLLDFGAARDVVKNNVNELTRILTEGYAPYEQDNPAWADQGPWTDIYALGATLYCAVMGYKPAAASSVRAAAHLLEKADPYVPATNAVDRGYSVGFLEAIDWALEFKPNDRPQCLTDWSAQLLNDASDATVLMPNRKSATLPSITANRSALDQNGIATRVMPAAKQASIKTPSNSKWLFPTVGGLFLAIIITGLTFSGLSTTNKVAEAEAEAEEARVVVSNPKPAVTVDVASTENLQPVTVTLPHPPVSDMLFVLVSQAMLVGRTAVVQLEKIQVDEENIEELKQLSSDSQRTKFIVGLQFKVEQALTDVDKNMSEYTFALMRLKRYSSEDVTSQVKRYLDQPDYKNRAGYFELGDIIEAHARSSKVAPDVWKQDLFRLAGVN